MKVLNVILVAVTAATLAGCATISDLFEGEEEVALSEVPAPVLTAAKKAVEGIVLSEAEIEEEDGQVVYELAGTADGKCYEIEVSAEGKVLEIEEDGEDD